MAHRNEHGLMPTLLGVSTVMLALAIMLIAAMANRPAGAITVPKNYHVEHVTLAEWSVRGAPKTVPAGNYEFIVTNHGTIPHELVMWATKDSANALPRAADGRVNEDSSKLESVLDTGSALLPGETRIVFADLTTPGHYAMVCNLPVHYQSGMREDLTVR